MKKNQKPSRFAIDIPVEEHKRLKTLAAMHGKSMKEIVMQSIKEQIKKLEKKTSLFTED